MSWEAIGAIGEILGAVAVVVSIIYLTTQIRANTRQGMNAEMHHFQDEFSKLNELTLTNRDHVALLIKLHLNEDLTPEEQIRASAFANRMINQWGSAHAAYQRGQISEGFYRNVMCADVRRCITDLPSLIPYIRDILGKFPEARPPIFDPIYEGDQD